MVKYCFMDNFNLYRHTSPSGKCYIGITKQDPIKRWGAGGYCYLKTTASGTPKHPAFYNSIAKYGWDNIKHEILFSGLSKDRACSLEQSLIRHYKNLGLSYNTTDGGEGIWGYKFTPEQIKRLSESHKGIKQSKESIAKRITKLTGQHRTIEQRKTFGKTGCKPVVQYTKEGEFVAEYFGVNEAQRATGIKGSHIGQCCDGALNRKTSGGFIWKWKGDDTPIVASPRILKYSLQGELLNYYKTVKEASKDSGIHASGIHRCLSGETKHPRKYIWKYENT